MEKEQEMKSHVFPRDCRKSLPTIVSGDGVYLTDTDGRRYLDGCCGAAVSCLGHSNEAVVAAATKQLNAAAWAHTSFFTSAPAEELAAELSNAAPGELRRVYFTCGGSEAVEAALKLARQYYVERGELERCFIVSRRQSYHGNTLGALTVGNNPRRRDMFAPLLFDNVRHISPCHYWRYGEPGESPEEYGQRTADELEDMIEELGAKRVLAFVAETVPGATLGAVPAVAGYFRRVREICTRHDVLLVLDEVMCGMGRTGALFACEDENVAPDMVCVAKGLGGGIQPLGAMLCTEKIYETVAGNSGAFRHGHTYMGHPTACAAGVAVLDEIRKNNLIERVKNMGGRLQSALSARLGGHPHVGDIRGRGLFLGVEFVAKDKTPFAPGEQIHAKIKSAAFARGLMVYGMGGCADGESGDHLLIAPPFIIEDEHITELVDKLSAAVDEVIGV